MSGLATGPGERVFAVGDLLPLAAGPEPGVWITAAAECPLRSHPRATWFAEREQGNTILHLPTESQLRLALELRRCPGVLAVVVDAPGVPVPAPGPGLALAFAAHLGAVRAGAARFTQAFVTGVRPDAVESLPDVVRLLHFATLECEGRPGDVVVWEWLPRPEAEDWFGGPLPDLRYVQAAQSRVLQLRRAARDGRLPETACGEALAAALSDRYFSGRFVLEHYPLVRRLLAGDHPQGEPS
jgi:hypothetical protein